MSEASILSRLLARTADLLDRNGVHGLAAHWRQQAAADPAAAADVVDVEAREVAEAPLPAIPSPPATFVQAGPLAPNAGSAPTAPTAPAARADFIRATPETDSFADSAAARQQPTPQPAAERVAGAAPRPAPTPASPQAPTTARTDESFTAFTFHHPHGEREAWLYLPPRAAGDTAPLPLVVMLHGCTQGAVDFAAGTRMNAAARRHGFAVLYPQQARSANGHGCWNWFDAKSQRAGSGEAGLLTDLMAHTAQQHALDNTRVYVAGLSAGGAMAAVLAECAPAQVAAVAVHSGIAPGVAASMPKALMAMKSGPKAGVGRRLPVPTLVLQGTADSVVAPANAQPFWGSTLPAGWAEDAAPAAVPGVRRRVLRDAAGRVQVDWWQLQGAPHAWSGGDAAGSYTWPQGPDATAAVVAFFGLDRG